MVSAAVSTRHDVIHHEAPVPPRKVHAITAIEILRNSLRLNAAFSTPKPVSREDEHPKRRVARDLPELQSLSNRGNFPDSPVMVNPTSRQRLRVVQ